MTNSPLIEGIPDPRKSSQLSSDDPVDPEKFKRMLKVENSEEMQKQHKRRRPKKAEEEEGPESSEDLSNTPKSTSFSDLFNPKSTQLDPFQKKGTKETKTVSSQTSPLVDSSIYFLKTQKLTATSPFLQLEATLPTAKKIQAHQNFLRKPKKETISQIQLEPLEKSSIAPLAFKESSTGVENLKNLDKSFEPTSHIKESKKTTSLEESSPTLLIDGIGAPLVPIAKDEKIEEESQKISSLEKKKSHSLQKEHKDKKGDEDEDESNLVIQQPTDLGGVTPPLLTSETPAYATLSPNVYELFEKLVGLLMIEEHKGISITTIKLSMPGSVFNNCEIKLEHFDTAPNSFNIQLLGNPSAVDLFNANYQGLVNAMSQSNFSFKANIRRPILLESYQHLIRRKKEQSFDDSDKEQAS
jgi:hypothetical protein